MAHTEEFKVNKVTFDTISFLIEEERLQYRKEHSFLDYDFYKRKDCLLLNVNLSNNKKYQYSEAYFKIDKETGLLQYNLPKHNYKTRSILIKNIWQLEEHFAIFLNGLPIKKQ